jgi:hypothetical protein
MDKTRTTTRIAITLAVAGLFLSGCGTTNKVGDWFRGKDTSTGDEAAIIGAPSADSYLSDLYDLNAGDERKQANITSDAESAARLTPGPSTTLKLALVLATPGHAGYDPARAATLLHEVLDQQPLLTSAETSLATIYLNSVERVSEVASEASRLRSASERAAASEARAANSRISNLEAENRQLRNALAEAEQKLEAITSIERSIRDGE